MSITITNWIAKTDEPGEYIGFNVTSNATDSLYLVKAGLQTYQDSSSAWLHPDSASGAVFSAISYVDFCIPPAE